ncbi:MAG: helix-turn-helix domain-containing protein, partial [Candidatus Krumholzibacteria bacterium]|nr:helix-turn-helix domain-containing protein [Candidatus Krumholzibacteria bacterium]
EDLYYRLNVIALRVPPLRERPEDVALLGHVFLARFAGDMKRDIPEFAPQTLQAMESYNWPGNVRQLKNAVERMVVMAPGNVLLPELLPAEIRTPDLIDPGALENLPFREAVAGFKRNMLTRILDECHGNQTRAAEKLGLQRSYLNRLLKDLGLRAESS